MIGVHDMGGMRDFGPVIKDEKKELFYAEWEKKVFALLFATVGQGLYNLDEFRHAIERMDPANYLNSSYYERWLSAYETLLVEKGIFTKEQYEKRVREFAEGKRNVPIRYDSKLTKALLELIDKGASTERDEVVAPRFKVGDTVVVKDFHTTKHTRCPRYVQGKKGVIILYHRNHVYPDFNAHGKGESPRPLYTVKFKAADLWGDVAKPKDTVCVDLWESYLEPAS